MKYHKSKISPANQKFASNVTDFVEIQMDKDGLGTEEPISIPDLFNKTVTEFPNNPALVYQDSEKQWKTINYQEYQDKVCQIAKAFIKLGLEERTSVAVLSFNCPEWFYSELATIWAGGIITGIYTTNSAEAAHYILESSDSRIVVVDDTKQLDKIRKIKDKLPNLKAIIQIHGPFDFETGSGYYKWSDIEQMDITDNELDIALEYRLKNISVNECCSLIYTSGTTGNPKAAMISHDNFSWGSKAIGKFFGNIEKGKEVTVSYLPLNHIAAQILDIAASILFAGCVYFADRDALKGTLLRTLAKARPTFFFGVPRVWEKFHEKLNALDSKQNWFNNFISNAAKHKMLNYHLNNMNGSNGYKLDYMVVERILRGTKRMLGFDRCKVFLTGAAPILLETKEYFFSINIPLREVFGLTESGPVCGCYPTTTKNLFTTGLPFPGVQITIKDPNQQGDGEIYMKGRNVFMGYLNQLDKTEESFDDGWYKSGDLGRQDEYGQFYITGRIKELIITAGGENIPPVHIENLIKTELPALSNVVLVGDKKKYLTVLITIKTEINSETGLPLDQLQMETTEWMKSLGLEYQTLTEILEAGPCPIVLNAIQDGITRANKGAISNAQKVQKFAILPNDFSMPAGELGPTLKLKRHVVYEKYADLIDSLYA